MSNIIGTAFISHGIPTLLIEKKTIHDFYYRCGKMIKDLNVDTIIVSSPHYISNSFFEIDSRDELPCLQDFYGFPDELYEFNYKANNNTDLVNEIIKKAGDKKFPLKKSSAWGLDHGAWLPLYFMFPKQDIKVVPVSITNNSPEKHFELGALIAEASSATNTRAFFIATGSVVSRPDKFSFTRKEGELYKEGKKFNDLLIKLISEGDYKKVLQIKNDYPELFQKANPEGNLNTLFTALGATDKKIFLGKSFTQDFVYYSLSLNSFILSGKEEILNYFL